jgi:hypothetical protein
MILDLKFFKIKIFLFLGLLLSVSLFFYFSNNTETRDPLKELFSSEVLKNNLKNADFITSSIYPYSGPVSNSITECKKNFIMEEFSGKVVASFNKNFTFSGDKLDIKKELNPVLGYAIVNEEINWNWDADNLEYTFIVSQEDELFWRCYFENETKFFKEFFISESVQALNEKKISDNNFIKIKIHNELNNISYNDFPKNKNLTLFKKNSLEEVDLGYINIDSSISDNDRLWENLFLTQIKYSNLNFSFDKTYYQTSTVELLQNLNYPFLNLLVFSSNEIGRNMAKESIENISINYVEGAYNMKLRLNDTTPNNTSYQIVLDNSFFPLFYEIQDDLSSKEISHSLIPDGKGSLINIINEKNKNCETNYAPVCGKVIYYGEEHKETFMNRCLLDLKKAEFLSFGTCAEYISSQETSY